MTGLDLPNKTSMGQAPPGPAGFSEGVKKMYQKVSGFLEHAQIGVTHSYVHEAQPCWGGRHSTEVAFTLHAQAAQVQISAFPRFFLLDVAELIDSERTVQ